MQKGRVVWITGGGSGIGLAGAIELARAGAHVVISGRSAETLKKAEKEVKAAGSCETIALDVADQKEVAKAGAEIAKRHGRIDILINSAGINHPKRNFRSVSIDGWNQIVAINLTCVMLVSDALGMRLTIKPIIPPAMAVLLFAAGVLCWKIDAGARNGAVRVVAGLMALSGLTVLALNAFVANEVVGHYASAFALLVMVALVLPDKDAR